MPDYKSFSRKKLGPKIIYIYIYFFFSLPPQWHDYSSRIRGNISSCRSQYAARWRANFSYSRKCQLDSNSNTGHPTYQCAIAISQWPNVSTHAVFPHILISAKCENKYRIYCEKSKNCETVKFEKNSHENGKFS